MAASTAELLNLGRVEVRWVVCPACGARAGERCLGQADHPQRVQEAQRRYGERP